jgi:hypothetical protein
MPAMAQRPLAAGAFRERDNGCDPPGISKILGKVQIKIPNNFI